MLTASEKKLKKFQKKVLTQKTACDIMKGGNKGYYTLLPFTYSQDYFLSDRMCANTSYQLRNLLTHAYRKARIARR